MAVIFCEVSLATLANTDCNKRAQTSCTIVKIRIQTGGNFEASEAPGGQFFG